MMIKRLHFKRNMRSTLIGAMVLLLVVFSLIVSNIGYVTFSNSLEREYSRYTLNIAKTGETLIKADNIDTYLETGGAGAEYELSKHRMDVLCKKMDVNVLYIIKPSADFLSYTSVMNCVNENKVNYTPWEVGHEEKSGEDYIEIYKDMYAGKIDNARVLRTKNLNGAPPHITTLLALKGEDGAIKGIFCVQTPMEELARGRATYLTYIAISMFITALFVSITAAKYLTKQIVNPITTIKDEAKRFALQNTQNEEQTLENLSRIEEIVSLADSIHVMESDTLKYIDNLTAATSERERIGTELGIAAQIQTGLVPSFSRGFPERTDFALCASMTPAKEVGGDFYDYFMLDDDHVALVMADVSGKGIPAALFMMVTKILIKENAKISGHTPAQVLEFVNNRIVANNPADMFVTVWLGFLELSTGKLIAANAGHDDPAICREGGSFEICKSRHGLVVGAMDGVPYKNFEITLNKGDKFFLYTDGLPEATDANETLLTLDGMLELLNAGKDKNPEELLRSISEGVDRFVGDAPQFDDLTMLCLELKETCSAKKMKVEATGENLEKVMAFVDSVLEENDCSPKSQMQIDLAVEEIYVNIANYAYGDGTGTAEISVSVEAGELIIVFKDSGTPYNPLEKEDPDTSLSAEERQIGGLGIFLVKKNMDDVAYEYKNGQNILIIKKKI